MKMFTTSLDTFVDYLEWPFIALATTGAVVFVLAYSLLAPWWRSSEGRHLFSLTLGLAALGGISVARRVLGGEWPYYSVTITVVYGLLTWELWQRVWLLLVAQGVTAKASRVWSSIRGDHPEKENQDE